GALLGATVSWLRGKLCVERGDVAFTWGEGSAWINAGRRKQLLPSTPQRAVDTVRLPLASFCDALEISWEMIRTERLIRVARPDTALASLRMRILHPVETRRPLHVGDTCHRLGHWLELHGVRVEHIHATEWVHAETWG